MLKPDKIQSFPEHKPRAASAPSPLNGLKVVDFSHFIAGPLATMLLADFGADVFKIETPGKGDDFRHYPPLDASMPLQGIPYLWCNRNKKSVAIDLKSPAGIAVVKELIATADVVVENFSTGVMERLGLGYETCRALNPRLIFCTVSAYGRSGPYADRLGFDPIAQAESGFIHMNGYPDRVGVRAGAPVMDIGTAMMASNAILLALLARERSGEGQLVELALFDNALLMTGFAAMQNMAAGQEYQRFGNTSPDTCPSGVFKASDKHFYLNSGNNKIFVRLFDEVLGRPDIATDPVLLDRGNRINHRDFLFKVLNDAFAEHPWSYWQPKLRAALVPHGEVRSLNDALSSDEARSRDLVSRIPHPDAGWVPNLNSTIRLSKTPAVDPIAAPALGEHTVEVLTDVLGFSEERIRALKQDGAFGKVTQADPA
ncbi:MAG: CaiB/BaiF CoA transferase family protein [Janthinobacterium lividum]